MSTTPIKAQETEKSLARVNQHSGLFVFTDCLPAGAYKFLGTISGAKIKMKSPQYTTIRSGLIEQVREEFPDANGVILHLIAGSKDKADVILIE